MCSWIFSCLLRSSILASSSAYILSSSSLSLASISLRFRLYSAFSDSIFLLTVLKAMNWFWIASCLCTTTPTFFFRLSSACTLSYSCFCLRSRSIVSYCCFWKEAASGCPLKMKESRIILGRNESTVYW